MSVDSWPNPITTRSRVVLEIAAELVAEEEQPLRQAKVLLREQGNPSREFPLCLFGTSTMEGVDAVLAREADLAIINPAGPLTVAYRRGAPLRTLAVIPSLDQYVFAVRPETNLTSFEQIVTGKAKLRISLRGQRDHCLHDILDHLLATLGTSRAAMTAWGCDLRYDKGLPYPDTARFAALVDHKVDAIFDEASDYWVNQALAAGLRILPLGEPTIRALEAIGYRRALIEQNTFPKLPADILTIDFSGWPIFVHAEAADDLVARFCRALDRRRHLIPWQGDGPLPTGRMCRDAPETPLDVPLHPAAEAAWRALGYLS
jgi:hypothetical protein